MAEINPKGHFMQNQFQIRVWRRGFTLVELLVVIAIIGILVGLLLPAVQAAREAARRMECGSKIKNLALALHNYESAVQKIPPAGFHNVGGVGAASDSTSWGPSWCVMVLPYIEQTSLHSRYFFNSLRARDSDVVVATRLPALLCPSDNFELTWDSQTVPSAVTGVVAKFARGNYAANGGAANAFSTGDYRLAEARGPFSMGGAPSNFAAVKDGLSNTIFLSELIIANRSTDVRGAWAYPVGVYFSGGSRFNNPPTPQGFLLPNGNALDDTKRDRSSFCSSIWATDRNLRCLTPSVTNRAYQTARSRHTGGVQVARGDGSVAFFSNSIERLTWLRLLSQSDGNVVATNE